MLQNQLISVRLDKETLDWINHYAAKKSYYTRSSIINRLLKALRTCSKPDVMWKLLECYDPYSAGYEISVTQKMKNIENVS